MVSALPRLLHFVAIVLALLVGPASLAAARQATPATPTVLVAPAETSAATPSGDQTLRLTGPITPLPTLDPALARDMSAAFFGRLLFRGLTRLGADLNPVPELAERIEISPDGLTYRFTLRPNAAFHDGRPIVAADVVASLARALDPVTAGGDPARLGGPTYLSDIDGAADVLADRTDELRGARAVDDRTVELRLAAPRATFLMKLAAAPAVVVDPVQAAADPEWWRAPNGSGPFRLAAFDPGSLLELAAFDGYAAGPPVLDRVQIRLGPSAVNAFNLYQSGQIDVTSVPVTSIDLVQDAASEVPGELSVVPQFATGYLAFRTDVPPLDDPNVRRALALAFPRERFVAVGLGGYRLPAAGLLPPGLLGRNWDPGTPGYAPAEAEAAFAASRYAPEPPPLRIVGLGAIGAETLRDTAGEALGLTVDVIEVEWTDLSLLLARQEVDAYEMLWIADYPDPESFLWSLFGSDSPDNFVGYANPEFDALLAEAAATLDTAARADLYDRAHRLLLADGAVLPLYHDVRYTLSQPEVRGLVVTPLGILDLDDVWLER